MLGSQDDLGLTIDEAFLIAGSIGNAVIEVEDQDGIVTLRGTVSSERDATKVLTLVERQNGVVRVINQLRIIRYE